MDLVEDLASILKPITEMMSVVKYPIIWPLLYMHMLTNKL